MPVGATVTGLGIACTLLLLLPVWGLVLAPPGMVEKVAVTTVALICTAIVCVLVFGRLATLWWEWGAFEAVQGVRYKGW